MRSVGRAVWPVRSHVFHKFTVHSRSPKRHARTDAREKRTRMNKADLIDAVAEAADISKAAAQRSVDSVFETITRSLANDDTVTIVGFGTFSVRTRAARTGRNPRTQEPMEIAESKQPVFKAGKALKDAVG